jgi:hypothetical protein
VRRGVRRDRAHMSSFDYYVPDPPIECPRCGRPLTEWQGKDGPAPFLFVWRQGVAAPVGERGDVKVGYQRFAQLRLPPQFWIYGGECGCGYRFDGSRYGVRCTAPEGVWRTVEIDPRPTTARDVGDGWIQCSECCEVWQRAEGRRLYLCPNCERLTELEDSHHVA